MQHRDVQVIWLSYFDSGRTRREGRRVPKRLSLDSPKLPDLLSACDLLGLEPEPLPDVKYPRSWWEKGGCILVKSESPKTETLNRIAEAVRRIPREEDKGRR